MDKEIIVLGDIEMGAGNLTDDFISDNTLSELILGLSKREHPVDLILNGDTFDFLKCPYLNNSVLSYPRHITEEISLIKLNLIYEAHKKVFYALSEFLRNCNNNLYFIVGNHDFDLVYPEVQDELKSLLNNSDRIHIKYSYQCNKVYCEHGQQYDFLNKLNLEELYLDYKGKPILNMPFVSFGLISKIMKLKEEYPFMERIMPYNSLNSFHRPVIKKVTLRSTEYFLKSMFYYPFRYYFDPTYFYPRELVKEFYRRLKKLHWEVDSIIDTFKAKSKHLFHKNKIHVLGHIHEKYVEEKEGTVIIHPGSWRDEYNLNAENKTLTPRQKRYVQIMVSNGELNYKLQEINIKRSILNFDQVILNELNFVKLAAKEEGYEPRLLNHHCVANSKT